MTQPTQAQIEAQRIFEQYYKLAFISKETAKKCALIDVHNTLKVVRQLNNYAFYQEVKTELEKY